MTAHSIGAAGATGYARYLEGLTGEPARGDYYLGRDGSPAEAPGRWLGDPEAYAALGIDGGVPVARVDLEALMEGRRPRSAAADGVFVRRAGADGTRAAGVDVTFSAPKSVSVAWALAGPAQREVLELAHGRAVAEAIEHLRATVAVTTGRADGVTVPERAAHLLAAEFRHSTARGVAGQVPDPQLHSHVLITSLVKRDGRVAAVRSRPVFIAGREVGAFYRAALADHLQKAGYAIDGQSGRDGRYFEITGVPLRAREAFSARSREVAREIEQFRAVYGRAPVEGELRDMALKSRQAKTPTTRPELEQSWEQTARRAGLDRDHVARLPDDPQRPAPDHGWAGRVEDALTRERAVFTPREARAVALEQAAGSRTPAQALADLDALVDTGRLVKLSDGRLTTAQLRSMEERLVEQTRVLAHDLRAAAPNVARADAVRAAQERLGAALSVEQLNAVDVLTGPERIAALEGPAGTGKGVVIDAVARAEQHAGHTVIGVAVAGATAQRLAHDCPALEGQTMTVDALLARSTAGRDLAVGTTVILDEAGMVDTHRLSGLVDLVDRSGAKLVLVGDGRQLPAIGPGGMFDQLTAHAPRAQLTDVRRTQDPGEQEAWRALRRGEPEPALAHYLSRDQLHLTDQRDQALEAAVRRYDNLARQHGHDNVALMTDGPTVEVERMNARAQHLRAIRGELGSENVELPDGPAYGLRIGDRVAWTAIQPSRDGPRVENGTQGEVIAAAPDRAAVLVEVDGSGRYVSVEGPELAGLRLGYAQHVYRQQGATVDHAVALTGGWQTSQQTAYVQASRSRHGTHFHIARDDLGSEGSDPDRIQRLADAMSTPTEQTPSIALARHPGDNPDPDPGRVDVDPLTLQLDTPYRSVGWQRPDPSRDISLGLGL